MVGATAGDTMARPKAKAKRGRPLAKDKSAKTLGYRVSPDYLAWIAKAASANGRASRPDRPGRGPVCPRHRVRGPAAGPDGLRSVGFPPSPGGGPESLRCPGSL